MDWLICIFVLLAKFFAGRKNALAWPCFILSGVFTSLLGIYEQMYGLIVLAAADIMICIWAWAKWEKCDG